MWPSLSPLQLRCSWLFPFPIFITCVLLFPFLWALLLLQVLFNSLGFCRDSRSCTHVWGFGTRNHTWERTCSVCLSGSGSPFFLVLFIYLLILWLRFSLWLKGILSCTCAMFLLSVHHLKDISTAPISIPLCMEGQRMLLSKHLGQDVELFKGMEGVVEPGHRVDLPLAHWDCSALVFWVAGPVCSPTRSASECLWSLYSLQHFLSVALFVFAILIRVKWNHKVVLICVPWLATDPEP